MRQRAVAWILSVFLLVIASLAQAQDISRDVTGTVVDRNNAPVAQAQVRFDGPANYISRTNSQGRFFLRKIRSWTYTVIVQRNRRAQYFTVTVTVSNGIEPNILHVNW